MIKRTADLLTPSDIGRASVVIAKEDRPEFVADYLNRCQEAVDDKHEIVIFLAPLSVERIENTYIPRFIVLSQPNSWCGERRSLRVRTAGWSGVIRHCVRPRDPSRGRADPAGQRPLMPPTGSSATGTAR